MYSQYLHNLIVSADDFGISAQANLAILELARNKKLDRVSVMMEGKISNREIQALIESDVKIDIHLHLFDSDFFQKREGEPGRGIARRLTLFLIDWTSGRYGAKRIKLAWQKQIKDFHRLFGRYPDGINSHEYLHFFPPFFKVALKLKDKFGISYLRIGKGNFKQNFSAIAFILDKLRILNVKSNRIVFAPHGFMHDLPDELNTSDFLVSFDWIKKTPEFFEALPNPAQIELIFHPEREKEFKFLKENF